MANIRRERQGARERLIISGELTVHHAASVAAALRDVMQTAGAVDVVLEHVTAADVTFPQALCAAHRTAATLNKEITVEGEKEGTLAGFLQAAGFMRHTGCQENTRKTCLWLYG
jgi:ABC-type transporter Mla MlaB component